METVSFVIPCYNEQETLVWTNQQIQRHIHQLIESNLISGRSKVVYVDDGSTDDTRAIISQLENEFDNVSGIYLKENVGQDRAIIAGMFETEQQSDLFITFDADLQDDLSIMASMISTFQNSPCDMVLGVRSSRSIDSFFKKITAFSFYRISRLMGIPLVPEHANFRLINRLTLSHLKETIPHEIFLRSFLLQLPLSYQVIPYVRGKREFGKTHYSFYKMMKLALNGILDSKFRKKSIGCWYVIENKK